jgi:hypothetical protein
MIIIAFNLLVGGLLFQYVLYSILGKDIHWIGDVLIGSIPGSYCYYLCPPTSLWPGSAICAMIKILNGGQMTATEEIMGLIKSFARRFSAICS